VEEVTWTRPDAAAFSLPVNALSQPVLSQFGYHIIR
jgi:parvulin-like peptidyl-prolyl isomerase